jgi:acyl carrier protein
MDVTGDVAMLIVEVLGIRDQAADLSAESGLLGTIPEFDSMAVVSVMTAIEEHFGIEIDDDEVSADIFMTVGTLAGFVSHKL